MPSNIFLYQLPKKEYVDDPDIFLMEDQDGTKTATISSIRTYFFQDYVIPSLSATLFHATSAIINTVNVTNYELSGFTVYGTLGINKNLHPYEPYTLWINSTGAMVVPVGSNARPPGNVQGALRFNVDLNSFEGNTGVEWVSLGETVNTVTTDLQVGALSAGQKILKGTSLEEFINLLVIKAFIPTTDLSVPYVTPSYSIQTPYFNGSQSSGEVEIGDNTVNITTTYGNDQKRYMYGRRSQALNCAWDEEIKAVYPNDCFPINSAFDNLNAVYAGPAKANGYEFSNDNNNWTAATSVLDATNATLGVTRNYNTTNNVHYVRVNTNQGPPPINSANTPSQVRRPTTPTPTLLDRWAQDTVITGNITVRARRKAFFKTDTTTTLPTFNSTEIRGWGGDDNTQAQPAGGNYYYNGATGGGFFFNPVAGSTFLLPIVNGARRVMLAIPQTLRASFVYEPTGYDDSGVFDETINILVNGRGASSNTTNYRVYHFTPALGFNASNYIVTLRNA